MRTVARTIAPEKQPSYIFSKSLRAKHIENNNVLDVRPVTSEVAGSSPVVPATFFNHLASLPLSDFRPVFASATAAPSAFYNGFPGPAEARPSKAMLQFLRVCLRWWKNFSCRSGQNSDIRLPMMPPVKLVLSRPSITEARLLTAG